MSPRGSSSASSSQPAQSTRSSNTPYTRRSANQPKSSRQQFSACGACRMRRVRCDLKDLPIGFVGPHPACSNCRERGIKCVDEFADVKAVKLLRRGRRLQQVEAIYGKVADQDGPSSSQLAGAKSNVNIPNLLPEFFNSPFWRWFSIQRPILDVHEFPVRFADHCKGTTLLANEGGLIAMLLVTWAASFGLDERGLPEAESPVDAAADQVEGSSTYYNPNSKYTPPGTRRRQWKSRCEEFVREILELVDYYGVLRRPTLDGVRVLLLVLPLMEESQALERLAISDSALSQVQALCVMSSSNASTSSFEDAAIRARLFWYAYTQEGITIGLHGGRFVLNGDDLDSFQRTLPNVNFDVERTGVSSPSPDPSPNMGPYHVSDLSGFSSRDSSSHKAYMHLWHSSLTPLDLNTICRRIHNVLTGIKASRRAEDHDLIDAHGMREIWRDLDRAWQDLENKKRAPIEHDNVLRLELNQYISAWQIFVFECHNIIREALKEFIKTPTAQAYPGSPPRPSSHSSNSSPYLSPQQLHVIANRKCFTLLPLVVRILRVHTPREHSDIPGIFRWDAGMVRDGCWFAGYLAANMDGEYLDVPIEENKAEDVSAHLTVDEGVSICLTALATMRWAFSKSEEREGTIRMIWENRKLRRQGQTHHLPIYDSDYHSSLSMADSHLHMALASGQHPGLSVVPSGDRPMLPPLNVFAAQRRVDSAPSTAASSEDRLSRWPGYTPPPTATSIGTSTGTGLSRRGSPVFAHVPSFKPSGDDIFYHGAGDMDQFAYNVPLSGPAVREVPGLVGGVQSFGPRGSPMEPHTLATSTAGTYMAAGTMFGPTSDIMTNADFHSCPQFGENCNGGYH